MADIQSKFAQSDAYLSALIREVRATPAASASSIMGRRSFFKLTGAGAAGLPPRRGGVRGRDAG